ncbi:Radical_SAM domain containing protein [uncultured Caudovirales phage]|uniref:Radical_SAM domain containing protein n=1 Tax=uncultured Caudovirales phage TaxID=2100421 RepID=A0A6J7WLK6_9CAUD|nr:Radical_SAM domain containing protein [uncultured Caudovirales phage]
MAPWTHTYLSPQTERRMCCASREPAQNFEQYIDTSSGTGKYIPITLDEHWNGEHMRSVRLRMMRGETLPECEVCNDKLLNTDVYRSYFNQLFENKYNIAMEKTDPTGYTTMLPVSWDYRFSNLCNFKCRMCGDMLSSAWETEQRQHDMIDFTNPKNNWMRPEVKKQIETFQDTQVEQEFATAVEEHRVEEVYWVGGEPLMYEQHWKYMKRIIELGDGPNVYARYNTNLSRVNYRGINLYSDILSGLRDWQICASLDGTGKIGEYIRTGLDFDAWLENFREGVKIRRHRRQTRIDFTLTLPGMFEVTRIERLAQELDVDVLAKVVFSFSPDIVMSPLALPRELLHPWVDEQISTVSGALRDVLAQLKTRPTFAEQWPDTYKAGLIKGKQRIQRLEEIRKDQYTMEDILAERPEVLTWWKNISP